MSAPTRGLGLVRPLAFCASASARRMYAMSFILDIRNEVFEGDNMYAQFFREFFQIGKARHASVIAHNLAENADRLETRNLRESHGRFRVTAALFETAARGDKAEHMPGAREVFCFRAR